MANEIAAPEDKQLKEKTPNWGVGGRGGRGGGWEGNSSGTDSLPCQPLFHEAPLPLKTFPFDISHEFFLRAIPRGFFAF